MIILGHGGGHFWKRFYFFFKICVILLFFYDFHLQYGKNFLVTKGGSIKNFLGSIKCPTGGGIRTLPFRRGVTVTPPPMPTYGPPAAYHRKAQYGGNRRPSSLIPVVGCIFRLEGVIPSLLALFQFSGEELSLSQNFVSCCGTSSPSSLICS